MANKMSAKKAAFRQSLKVTPSEMKSAKQSQFSSNNNNGTSSSSNKASAPARGKALGGGRGNER